MALNEEKSRLKKKILFIMQLPPPVHGVSVMSQLIRESSLINNKFNCWYVNLSTSRSVSDLQKGKLYKLMLAIRVLASAFVKLMIRRYDYVYITVFPHGPSLFKDSLIMLMAKLFFQKTIVHNHSYGFRKNAEASPLYRMIYKLVFRNTDMICLSSLLIEDIETVHTGKIYILPNGVPQVNTEYTYQNDQNPLTLLYLSNLIRGKGIFIVLEAARLLAAKGIDFKLRVAGPEGDVTYAQLESAINEYGIQKHVSLLGPKFGNEKYEEYRQAGLFLLPSDYDTFGLVLLDAMQFGVPCVSSRIGGIPDVLGDGRGVLIKNVDAEKLSQSITELINNPGLRKSMSQKSFEYFKLNYTTDIFEQRLGEILSGRGVKTGVAPQLSTA